MSETKYVCADCDEGWPEGDMVEVETVPGVLTQQVCLGCLDLRWSRQSKSEQEESPHLRVSEGDAGEDGGTVLIEMTESDALLIARLLVAADEAVRPLWIGAGEHAMADSVARLCERFATLSKVLNG